MGDEGKKTPGRTPTHNLSVMTRDTKRKGRLGAAWLNADGSIDIVLDPGAVLSWKDDLMIKLFPRNKEEEA